VGEALTGKISKLALHRTAAWVLYLLGFLRLWPSQRTHMHTHIHTDCMDVQCAHTHTHTHTAGTAQGCSGDRNGAAALQARPVQN
jgi:hypothetical protein